MSTPTPRTRLVSTPWHIPLAVSLLALAACADLVTEPPDGGPVFHVGEDGEEHSHGRYSHISWVSRPDIGANAVEFMYQVAFRRANYPCWSWSGSGWSNVACTGPGGLPGIGDVFTDNIGNDGSRLRFGDGSSISNPPFIVTAMNVSGTTVENWLFGIVGGWVAGTPGVTPGYVKEYATTLLSGPANNYDCCRIADLRNAGQNYGAQTTVQPGTGRNSAIANLPPIVIVPRGGVRTWPVPATSPDGHQLRWTLSTWGSLGGSQPAGMSLDPNSGIVSWDTDGRPLGYYWSNVTIDEFEGAALVGHVTVDYLIHLVEGDVDNSPPFFTSPGFCSASVNALVGQSLMFTVSAADPDVADLVTLGVSGLPGGATFEPPSPANPNGAVFAWTPPSAGPRLVTFIAEDGRGGQALCAVTIEVAATAVDPPVADHGGPYDGHEGSPVAFDASASSDPSGGDLSYSWDFGDGATGSGIAPSHTYADNGVYTVELTVTSSNGPQTTVTTTATIANVAPVVDAGPDRNLLAGQTFELSATFSDPGVNDAPWEYQIDWGDGSHTTGSTSDQSQPITATSPAYAEGSYTVVVWVGDKDFTVGMDQFLVTVTAVPAGTEACSPGFWSQPAVRRNLWPAGYGPSDPVSGVFAAAGGNLGSASLLEAVEGYRRSRVARNTVQGASEILLRAAVAAVLNEASFGALFPATDVGALQSAVNGALAGGDRSAIIGLAGLLDHWNNNYAVDENGDLVLDEAGRPVSTGVCPAD